MQYVVRQPTQPPPSPLLKKEGKLSPVLVVLHGYGTDEYDLLPIAEQIGDKFLIISLQAPIERPNGGHAWYDLIQTENGIIPDDLTRHESEEMLVATLPRIIEQEGGDASRVVLLGFSQGAAVIYSLLIVYDLKNYGIAPIASINMSGYIPRDILEAITEKRFDGFPFFISHGEFDDLIPMQALGEAEKLLTRQGADVTAKMYPVGHGVLPETVEDIIPWLGKITNFKLRITN
jgi:phospholipase/carboxylesterase